MKDFILTCPICNKPDKTTCLRADSYAQDVGNEIGATHIACDECDYQNSMDI